MLIRTVGFFVANTAGIIIAARFIHGFNVTGDTATFFLLGALLTALNLIVRPLLKALFIPIIIITLGFGILVVNGIVLKLLDSISENLTIETVVALAYATILMTGINVVSHFLLKR